MVKELTMIVPTYNKQTRLKFLLESIVNLENKKSFHTIIVNDGSTDNTEELLCQYQDKIDMTVISQTHKGRSSARNRGLNYSNTEYVLFCDDDMILPVNFINMHLTSLKQHEEALIHGKIWSLPYLTFFSDPELGTIYDELKKENTHKYQIQSLTIDKNISINEEKLCSLRRKTSFEQHLYNIYMQNIKCLLFLLCTGGNFSCRKDLIKSAGGFDESLDLEWGVEDLELGYRLQKAGVIFHYEDKAYNYHINHYRKTYREELCRSAYRFYKLYEDPLLLKLPGLLLGDISLCELLGEEIEY